MSNIYIPNKIKVGYQNRNGTYTGKLAYVIYYDEKGKLRKEKSWNGWRDEEIEPNDFENVPTRGLVLNKKVGDYGGSWGEHRHAYCRIYDPRGFEFEITIENLLFILEHSDCLRGKGLDGEFVYAWDGKDLVLVPVDSPDYKEIKTYTDKIQNGKKLKGKDLIIGATYLTKKNEQWVYMGRFDKWNTDTNCYREYWQISGGYWLEPLDDTWIVRSYDKHRAYRHVNKGKYYWFYNESSKYRSYAFESRKSIGDVLIECVDENPNQKYSEMFSDLENNCIAYNPIDYNSRVLIDFPYDKLLEHFTDRKYCRARNEKLDSFDIRKQDSGLFTCTEIGTGEYTLAELYKEIKPKYMMYKHIDGTEYHDYYNNIY